MNVDMDSIVVEIESSTKKASDAIDSLIGKLTELQTALSSIGKSSNTFKNIGKIASSNTKTSTIKSTDMSSQLDKMKLSLNKDDIVSKFTSTASTGITSEITKYKDELGNVVTVQRKMKDGMETYYRISEKTTKEQTTAFDKFKNSLAGVATKITLLVVGARKLLQTMIDLTESSAEYTEAVNLFYTEMGDKSKEAEKWVSKFSSALYLDPADVMQYMGAFNSLVSGLGVGADNSYKMSKNLTQLAYDLASYKNISVESAYDKLQSGVAGQIKGLRQVGVSLSQNTLQELANELGIKQRITTLDEASKAQLRYIQIMRSSTNWQADLGKTMMSTENILKSARQQWQLLVRALGDVAAVIVRQVMPYIIALTQLIKESAISLAKFFGLDINFADDFKDNAKSVGVNIAAIKNNIKNIGDGADKTRKKLNTMLAPFDDLNVVQTKVEKSGSGDSGALSSLGDLPLPEYDALAKLTSEWSDKIDDAKNKMKTLLPIVKGLAAVLSAVFVGSKIAGFIGSIKSIVGLFTKAGVAAKGAGAAASIGLGPVAAIIAAVVVTITNAISVGKRFSKSLDDITTRGKSIKEAFSNWSVFNFFQLFLPGGALAVTLVTLVKSFEQLKAKASQSKDVIKNLGDEISETGKTKLKVLVSGFESFSKEIDNLNFSNKIIKDTDITSIKSELATIKESIISELDADKNSQLKNLKTMEKVLGVDKANQLYAKTENYYTGQKAIITKNTQEIEKILQNASKNNRALTSDEISQIQKLRDEMYKTGVKSALEHSDDYYKIMGQLKNNLVALSTEQASSYIKKAKETRDKTIENAKEQYDSVVAEAYKMKEAGAITDEEYENIVASADQTYQQTVKDANKQYDEIYTATTTKLGETGRYIDKKTGEIKSNWTVFWEDIGHKVTDTWDKIKKFYNEKIAPKLKKQYWKDKFDEVVKGIKEALDGIKIKLPHLEWKASGGKQATGAIKTILETLKLPTSLPTLDIKWYEHGGYPDKASLFWANENGIPEMVGQIGNQTAVANNDQIITAMTNAMVTALSGMNFGKQGTTVVNIGNKKVYEGMGEYIDGESERYGTAYVNI